MGMNAFHVISGLVIIFTLASVFVISPLRSRIEWLEREVDRQDDIIKAQGEAIKRLEEWKQAMEEKGGHHD